jgi:primosomal protein N' (replication factor Y)
LSSPFWCGSPRSNLTYCDVVIDGSGPHLDRFFTYRVPTALAGQLSSGQYLRVPWGKKTRGAVVRRLRADLPEGLAEDSVREVVELVEPLPVLTEAGWELAEWLRDFYYGSWPVVLQTLLPGPVLEHLRKPPKRGRKARGAEAEESASPEELPRLTEDQSTVWGQLQDRLASGGTALLHGVTGSGKTEIYLRACQQVLSQGMGVLVLVPEVSLTPQAQQRFARRFGARVSILHSGLSDGERREQWWRIRRGERPLVVGTRSAIFAPLPELGLIIIDEEHDGSYKQNGDLRYHARQVAAWLSRRQRACLLLGSATPCLETYHLAREGRYGLLSLPRRVHSQAMPELRLVKGFGIPGLVVQALRETRERGQQSVVLLNRRGFSRYLVCHDCGWVPHCRDCSISLTFHKSSRSLRCHYCGASHPAPAACQECAGRSLELPGQGTERVEADLLARLPELRLARLDRDTVGGRTAVFEEVYGAFGRGEIDCLLGTQMVAKGLDFPSVSLVVVLEADTGLHLPDFRAAERTFALLTQVSGRAGRGQLLGQVMLVCQKPDHPLFKELLQHRWQEFMEGELALRRELGYPPYRRMFRLLVSDENPERAEITAQSLAQAVEAANPQGRVEVLGPAPCPIEKLQSRYRWHLLLKAAAVQDLQMVVRKALRNHEARSSRLALDPDPLELL